MTRAYRVCSDGCCALPQKPKTVERNLHPLDPLTADEVIVTAALIRDHAGLDDLAFNCITLQEPQRCEYTAFRNGAACHPDRRAFSIVLRNGTGQVSEAVVNLRARQIESWRDVHNVLPVYGTENRHLEEAARSNPDVIKVCRELGITDMNRVYFDVWASGVEDRWGLNRPLQQAIPYYRLSACDNQYAHPLDFSIVVHPETNEIISVDVRLANNKRAPIPLDEYNYRPEFLEDFYCLDRLKPIEINEPHGTSFHTEGNEITWAALKMHVGFNYREGIVLSDVRIDDPYEQAERTLFNRISIAEIITPHGPPSSMENSLQLGSDCTGPIHTLDAVTVTSKGDPYVIKNAICIHEEDNGLLYKHTDMRDNSVVSARDRKLVISQTVSAANFDYAFYHSFSLDGTYKLEVKMTGTPSISWLHQQDDPAPFGAVAAPDHQHMFSLRIDPAIDGPHNSVVQNDVDTTSGSANIPTQWNDRPANIKTPFRTASQSAASYCFDTSRTWDIINPTSLNPISKKPVAYRIFNRNWPPLYSQPEGKRAGVFQKALWVTPYRDRELYPAGKYLCQSHNPNSETILDWVARDETIDNTDIVCYVQFGIAYFPRTEDFPIMPVESADVTLRASNFFQKNPALWVPPSTMNKTRGTKGMLDKPQEHCTQVPKL
ncbi:copper amine oxidase [Aspergillus alliaceus]|uniref:Amine oxidase n=1 Tax=Petromyces alliaceus TaxID=209559 RepID=A0A5N7CKX7_PETAA|nr:copper amine oxidase [Aspergillus alliaceus]